MVQRCTADFFPTRNETAPRRAVAKLLVTVP